MKLLVSVLVDDIELKVLHKPTRVTVSCCPCQLLGPSSINVWDSICQFFY